MLTDRQTDRQTNEHGQKHLPRPLSDEVEFGCLGIQVFLCVIRFKWEINRPSYAVYNWYLKLHYCDNVLLLEKKSAKPEPGECIPPDYLLPGCKDRPLVPLHPIHKELKVCTNGSEPGSCRASIHFGLSGQLSLLLSAGWKMSSSYGCRLKA